MEPTTTSRIAAELRAEIARRQLRHKTLATRLGEHPDWLARRVKGHVPIHSDDLQRICEVIGCDAGAVMTAATRRDPATIDPHGLAGSA